MNQFGVLLTFKITGLQFFIYRAGYMLKFDFDDK